MKFSVEVRVIVDFLKRPKTKMTHQQTDKKKENTKYLNFWQNYLSPVRLKNKAKVNFWTGVQVMEKAIMPEVEVVTFLLQKLITVSYKRV